VPGGAPKRPEKPPPMVENAAPHLYPQIPPPPLKRPPTQTPDIVRQISLTHNSPFCIFNSPQSGVLSKKEEAAPDELDGPLGFEVQRLGGRR